MYEGTLYIISAPSGCGKTSLIKNLVENLDDISVVTSHTTRSQRLGEENDSDYYFVSKSTFSQMIHEDKFLEYAEVFGNLYGTSYEAVEEGLSKGDVILEIDWQGARQIRDLMSDTVSIFILPPNRAALERRLWERNLDDAGIIQQRTCEAKLEISHYNEYDYLVLNDDFAKASWQLQAIVVARRQSLDRQKEELRVTLKDLVG